MADEQPNTPSVEPEQSDAAVSDASSTEGERTSSESPSWWRRIFDRRPGGAVEDEPADDAEPPTPEPVSSKLSLTQEELDRRVQAETDRREAKRLADARAQRKRELRETDPWAYAEEEKKEEQAAVGTFQLEQFVTNVGAEHDRVTIDPIFLALPKAEQDRIQKLEGAGRGLEGRKLVVRESLKALEKHWKAEGAKDAETKLRKNPAFRKQVLGEVRGQTPEPELLPAGSASEADKTVSDLLRTYYRLG
jgi:hypothetical protein